MIERLWSLLPFLSGYLLGRFVRDLTRPRCPELTLIQRYDHSWSPPRLRSNLERCKLRDFHHGPCCIDANLPQPHYWEPDEDSTRLNQP